MKKILIATTALLALAIAPVEAKTKALQRLLRLLS